MTRGAAHDRPDRRGATPIRRRLPEQQMRRLDRLRLWLDEERETAEGRDMVRQAHGDAQQGAMGASRVGEAETQKAPTK